MPPKGGRARASRGRGGTARAAAEAPAAESSTPAASDTPVGSAPGNVGASESIPTSDSTNAGSRSDTVASASPAAAPSSTPTTSSSRGTTRGSKYKPKAVRRGSEERLRLAEEVARAQAQRNAEEARVLARANRGRRGRGRARGGFMRDMARGSTAAGPLSSGMSIGSGSGSKGGAYGSPGLLDHNRINADTLYTAVDYSDEEEPAIKGRQKKKKAPMPMGIRRVEHEEEKLTMASTAEIEAKERGLEKAEEQDDGESSDGLFVDEPRTKRETKQQTTHIPAKDEGVWEHALPESRVKIKAEEADLMDLDDIPDGSTTNPDSPDEKKEDILKIKKKKAETEEELLAKDLEHMISFFTFGDDVKKGEEKEGVSSKDGHMFLFQFPPILPPLTPVAPAASKPVVKPEPTEEDDDDEDPVMFALQKKTAPVNIDLTEGADKIKNEEDAEDGGDENAEPQEEVGGFVGNLVVRKSGKVELSWGGNTLVLAPGTQANFLSQAVLLEQSDVKPQPGQVSGTAYGMGKIWGSFSAVPTWGGEEEWTVDPEDLIIPDE
ncbi:RNA polymerase III RPC4-domain-containing protein [Podospora aff. communis PSN243]|uniref:RNA polymerase III RPC4-domain-containing protein n=1 Tax=Podospora aff. communis PSN243 TaxID=3040156 RepID=A0AAV9GXM9_9PEZI|nr:RNA polymerase III RPC4-domain-containing protein [Podospora aff. communis PSN243]